MVAALGATGVFVAGTAAASAEPAREAGGAREITLAYVTTQQHPYGQAIDYFVTQVNRLSGGRIKIVPRPSYPAAEPQLLNDVRSGTIPMATMSTAIFDSAGITAFQALQAPFLVNGYPLERQIIAGRLGRSISARATQQAGNLYVLAIHEGGIRYPLGSTKSFTTVNAFRNAKIRSVQSKVLFTGLQTLGASPDPLPLPEVYLALKNGTVDGMEANIGLIATNKYFEVAKNVTANVPLWPFPTALSINRAFYNSLSRTEQTALRTAANLVPAYSIGLVSRRSTLPQDLVNCGVRFKYARNSEVLKLQALGRRAYASLSRDATTRQFITAIQRIKADFKPPKVARFPSRTTGSCTLS
jgi:TRAP-type C4-dicarboxylate transport system substrate-binding protein